MPSHWQDLELGADLPSSLKKGPQPTSCCGECMCEAFRRARGLQLALRKCSRIYPAMRNQCAHIRATQDDCHLCSSYLTPPCLFPAESQPRQRPPATQRAVPTSATSSHHQELLRTAPVPGDPWAQKTGQRTAGPAGDRHLSPCCPGAESPKKAFWPKKMTSSSAGAGASMPVCVLSDFPGAGHVTVLAPPALTRHQQKMPEGADASISRACCSQPPSEERQLHRLIPSSANRITGALSHPDHPSSPA